MEQSLCGTSNCRRHVGVVLNEVGYARASAGSNMCSTHVGFDRKVAAVVVDGASSLSGQDLSGRDLFNADLCRADLSGANLSGADLVAASLIEADLLGANLRGANLYGANLSRARLAGADLARANLSRANLSEVSLVETDLSEDEFSRHEAAENYLFRRTIFGGTVVAARLVGAFADGDTIWPEGFDPVAAGVVSTMCDQCPDDGDAIEEARWALNTFWGKRAQKEEERAQKEQARIWREERVSLSKEDAEARAKVWIGRARAALSGAVQPDG